MDAGRNVLIAASSDVSELMRTLATEVGIDLDDKGTKVFDHFSYATFADGTQDHTAILTRNVVQSAALVGAASLQVGHAASHQSCVCSNMLMRECW